MAVSQTNRGQNAAELIDAMQVERHTDMKQFLRTVFCVLRPRAFLVTFRGIALLWRINAEESNGHKESVAVDHGLRTQLLGVRA